MPVGVSLILTDAGFCFISLNSIGLYSGMHLHDLGSVSDISGLLLSFLKGRSKADLQSRVNLAPLVRQHPSEDSAECPW